MNEHRHVSTPSKFNVRAGVRGLRAGGITGLSLMLATVVVGCTFINSFDDLKPFVPDTGANDSGPGVDSGLDTTPGDTFSGDTDLPDTHVDPTTQGLIVVGGEVASGDAGSTVDQVLAVINPTTGQEFAAQPREAMVVVNAMYDGNQDVWYIFENTSSTDRVQPAPGDAITLHVRAWDYDAGKWKADLATVTGIPTPFTRDAMTILNQEIAYVAFTGTGSTTGLVLYRTDDSAHPTQIGATAALGSFPIGVVGVRKGGGAGGSISILSYGTCTSTGVGCPIELVHYTAPATFGDAILDTTLGTKVVGTIDSKDSNASFGSGIDVEPFVFIGTPYATLSDQRATVQILDPNTFAAESPAIHFATTESSKFLRGMAVDECDKVLFIPELLSSRVHVVPLDKPDVALEQNVDHLGQAVAWEPYTKTMLAPYKQGVDFQVPAWRVAVDSSTKVPTLTKRGSTSDWKFPVDLRPNIVTPKSPVGFGCK